MKTTLSKKRLQQHFQYSWWMYALSLILCIFLWDIVYTVTEPRTPENEKLEVYLYAYGDSERAQQYLDVLREGQLEDVKEMTAVYVMPDDSSGPMVLSTRIMAGEGDLFLLPRDTFQSYASQGLFVALDEIEGIEETVENLGINAERGWRKNQDSGERHLYGIPVASIPELAAWSYASDMYLSVRVYNGNDENAIKLFRLLIEDTTDIPDSV
ncbi:MAG: hypothetical protein IJ229_03735 [Clostridia bacterium]|nr:hypothetical protein [Clostridia bacterium]MBR1685780.1 hypothetical protein [Clostridia bacterium]MBR2288733.1 hypothetical protein [Clostridia bacterium]